MTEFSVHVVAKNINAAGGMNAAAITVRTKGL
jgi:hypothetical protein